MDFRQAASHTAPHQSQVITALTASQILETFLSQTGIVVDLVCPLKQLLWARHAVVRTNGRDESFACRERWEE